MVIKVSELQFNEDEIYKATIEDVKFGTGNYGDYVAFTLSTEHGQTSYFINMNAKVKMIRFLYACGYNVNEMKPDDEIDLEELVNKTVGVKLQFTSDGYLRVQSVLPYEDNTDDEFEELVDPENIFE